MGLFKRSREIRIDPQSEFTKDETELALFLIMTLRMTYPYVNHEAVVDQVKSAYKIDDATASWWVKEMIRAGEESGQLR